jgi:hypothetical protein
VSFLLRIFLWDLLGVFYWGGAWEESIGDGA